MIGSVRNLYIRLLKYPYADIDQSWTDYSEWEKDDKHRETNEKIYL